MIILRWKALKFGKTARTFWFPTLAVVSIVLSASTSRQLRISQETLFQRTPIDVDLFRNESIPELAKVTPWKYTATNISRLPDWFHKYVSWHRDRLSRLNAANWHHEKYVLLRCVKGDIYKCRGASDRLKMVSVMIRMAAQTNRLFFIHWSSSAPIEEFLVPNLVNWTLPMRLHPLIEVDAVGPIWTMRLPGRGGKKGPGRVGMYNDTKIRIIRIQAMVHANAYYDKHRMNDSELLFWDVYHNFWNAIFQPSLPIRARIDDTLRKLDFLQGDDGSIRPYVSVHVRARYVGGLSATSLEEENAIRCASQLQREFTEKWVADDSVNRSVPIYVATDSAQVTRRAVDYGRAQRLIVVARPHVADPWHLDRGDGAADRYYDNFVDLYLLSLGECYTWGLGGYGPWAANMGHMAQKTCTWAVVT